MQEQDLLRVHRIGVEDRLVCIHIPKSGGTTLVSTIDPLWKPEARFPVYNEHELRGIVPESLDRYQSFVGHFALSEIEWLVGRPFRSITMLREPTARYLSNFLHIKYKPRSEVPYQARPELDVVRAMSLEEFVSDDSLLIPRDSANLQTRLLGAPIHPPSLPASRSEPYQGVLDRRKLQAEQAQRKLTAMDAFGLTERMQDSLFLFAYTFGWKPLYETRVLNKREAAAEQELVTDTARERMRALNDLDVQLYDFAADLFERRFRLVTEQLLSDYGTRTHAHLKYPLPSETVGELLEKHHRNTGKERANFWQSVLGKVRNPKGSH